MSTHQPNRLCVRAVDFTFVSPEERSGDGEDGRTLEGYAAVFDTPTEINGLFEGHFNERIAKGAFRKTIKEGKPILQYDHGHDARTGSLPIGSIQGLREDDRGLFVNARLFDNDLVEPIRQAIEGGAVSGMSFRFRVLRDEWRDKNDKRLRGDELGELLFDAGDRGPLERTIKEVQLFELGPVAFPAYSDTSVGVRSLTQDQMVEQYRATIEDPEEREEEPPPEEGAAADEGTPDSVEVPRDAAPFVGTSAGHRSKTLRELRMKRVLGGHN